MSTQSTIYILYLSICRQQKGIIKHHKRHNKRQIYENQCIDENTCSNVSHTKNLQLNVKNHLRGFE